MIPLEAKVERGLALLDRRMPGWRERIDLDLLDMGSCSRCILGQLFGNYCDGFDELGIDAGSVYGFDSWDEDYQTLDEVWRRALTPDGAS